MRKLWSLAYILLKSSVHLNAYCQAHSTSRHTHMRAHARTHICSWWFACSLPVIWSLRWCGNNTSSFKDAKFFLSHTKSIFRYYIKGNRTVLYESVSLLPARLYYRYMPGHTQTGLTDATGVPLWNSSWNESLYRWLVIRLVCLPANRKVYRKRAERGTFYMPMNFLRDES
jgi:hypothetical protein